MKVRVGVIGTGFGSEVQIPALWGRTSRRDLGRRRYAVDHLAGALLDGAPVAPAATFHDGLQVQLVLDAVRQATGAGWIQLHPGV